MHIALLFSPATLLAQEDTPSVNGRAIANNGFTSALLRDAKAYGARVTLVTLPDRPFSAAPRAHKSPDDCTRNTRLPSTSSIAEALASSGIDATEIIPFVGLPDLLKTRPIDVLHELDPNIHRGLYIRNNVAAYPFAVTGLTHALGYATFNEWMLLNLLGRPQACDALICTTPTAETVVRSLVDTAARALGTTSRLGTAVIPLGIPPADSSADSQAIRREYAIPDAAVVILTLGRLSCYTKVDLLPLLLAFRNVLRRTSTDTRLILAGATGGENYAPLLREAAADYGLADNIIVIEDPPHRQKRELYASADLFVALGDNPQETFGLAVVEAASAGLPVIASDWNGYKSLVKHEETGFLIPTVGLRSCRTMDALAPLERNAKYHFLFSQSVATDLGALADRIVELVDDAELRGRFSHNARGHAKQFDWKHVVARHLELWTELATHKPLCEILPGIPPTLRYRDSFRDYPTSCLNEEDEVATSDDGERLLSGDGTLRPYGDLRCVLAPPVIDGVLASARGGARVDGIRLKLGSIAPADVVDLHVVWLHKYGLLSHRRAESIDPLVAGSAVRGS